MAAPSQGCRGRPGFESAGNELSIIWRQTMKKLSAILVAVALTAACGGGGRRPGAATGRGGTGRDRSDQRRGRDFPESDLLEVVRRVQQAAPERADQLPVDRLGRRHPAADEPDGVLRRHRRPDDRRDSSPRRRGKILHLPTVLGAVVPVYNIPGVNARAEVHRADPRGHLPRQDHEVERPGASRS